MSIVKKLLYKGADIDILTRVSSRLLSLPWLHGPQHVFLLQSLWSALHWTAQEGHTEVARLLLERGATATTQDKVYSRPDIVHEQYTFWLQAGFSPFLQACQDGKFDIVKLIMKHTPELDMNECTKVMLSHRYASIK